MKNKPQINSSYAVKFDYRYRHKQRFRGGGRGAYTISIELNGRETDFGILLADRLTRTGIDIDSPSGIKVLCWNGGDGEDCDILIRPVHSPEFKNYAKAEIVLHDLCIPLVESSWGPSDIWDILESLGGGTDLTGGVPRHWVNVRDVVDAIALLLESPLYGRLDVSGRRCWSNEALFTELSFLHRRTMSAMDKSFTFDDLSVVEVRTEPDESVERPNLSTLHDALSANCGEGWRPIVPFRVTLMEMLAAWMEPSVME